jgi:hypothetical protein
VEGLPPLEKRSKLPEKEAGGPAKSGGRRWRRCRSGHSQMGRGRVSYLVSAAIPECLRLGEEVVFYLQFLRLGGPMSGGLPPTGPS